MSTMDFAAGYYTRASERPVPRSSEATVLGPMAKRNGLAYFTQGDYGSTECSDLVQWCRRNGYPDEHAFSALYDPLYGGLRRAALGV